MVEGVESPLNESECVKLDLADLVRRQSTPKTASSGGNVNSGSPDNPLMAAKLKLDQVVTEHAQSLSNPAPTPASSTSAAEVSSYEQDRELE